MKPDWRVADFEFPEGGEPVLAPDTNRTARLLGFVDRLASTPVEERFDTYVERAQTFVEADGGITYQVTCPAICEEYALRFVDQTGSEGKARRADHEFERP
ncbi:hypothetical protein SAMN05421770_101861 [Granulicella rosea]|uniref:Uncharacterized protein n=1 Tax=Granulicella rosea TaxID=474952 RepID=A0A239E8Y9_9BACT|nr:hypothetical protein [Granulicella rosea]SNS41155.1 hypothetical protein SAMN05421770_101861 [Granulicella rosea]